MTIKVLVALAILALLAAIGGLIYARAHHQAADLLVMR